LDNHPTEEYLKLFESPKILYPEITKFLPFYLDTDKHYYSNNKTFFITGSNLEYLVCFLNSRLFQFCFKETFPELIGDSRELRKVFMEQIPILEVTNEVNEIFKNKLTAVYSMKENGSSENENKIGYEIDQMIYDIYGLMETEIKIVEAN
jgi:adenine-specific DNA-methyltransferase